MYPNAFQDVDIMTELIKETEEKDITTLAYRCSSHFIFSSKEEHLPSPVDLYSIAIRALNRDLFSGGFRTSSDVVLSAASDGFILTADEYFQHSKPYAKENAQASLVPPAYTAESESSPSINQRRNCQQVNLSTGGYNTLVIRFLEKGEGSHVQ